MILRFFSFSLKNHLFSYIQLRKPQNIPNFSRKYTPLDKVMVFAVHKLNITLTQRNFTICLDLGFTEYTSPEYKYRQ